GDLIVRQCGDNNTTRIQKHRDPPSIKNTSPTISPQKICGLFLKALYLSPPMIRDVTGVQTGTNITLNEGDRITGDTADPSGNLYGVMTPAGNTPGNINLGNDATANVNDPPGYAKGIFF
ncbi:hypothetical protein KCA24_34680, partial [Escherichia coli]|nr:hypothetical protein [Escherichia coli]